jgi:hypothetical protein
VILNDWKSEPTPLIEWGVDDVCFTLYSAEEIHGTHFFPMELVDGRPLDELILAEGFPADRVVESRSRWQRRSPPPTTNGSCTAT